MNPDLLREADPHVREEFEKLRDLLGVMERTADLLLTAYLSGTPHGELPGSPPADPDDRLAWLDWAIGQGALVFHEELPLEV